MRESPDQRSADFPLCRQKGGNTHQFQSFSKSLCVLITMSLDQVFSTISEKQEEWINLLREAVAIKSVSAWPETRNETIQVVHWFAKLLEQEGVKVEIVDNGTQKLPGGKVIPLPPILLGNIGNDPSKKTLLVYGHLDVQPAAKEDGWDTDPFVLTDKDGKLYGRGSTDDKGPVLGWLITLQVLRSLGIPIPVNLKFCFEAMEESGSEGLDELVEKR